MTDQDPDLNDLRRSRQKSNTRVVAIVLVAFVALIYFVTIARMGAAK